MTGLTNGAPSRRVSFRTLALLGSALGSTLVTVGAGAQTTQGNVTSNGTTDYTLTETGTRQGGPRTIDVTTSGGNIAIDVQNVEAVNNSGALGGAIFATNTGTGTVSVRAANTTATGNSVSRGISVAGNGAVNVTSTGTASADIAGTDSRAINAVSNNGGTVTVVSNIATGTQRGLSITSIAPVAGGGNTLAGTVNVTSTTATATGTGIVNAIVAQADRVIVNSGTATNSNTGGTSGTAIFANAGAGGVLLTAGNTSALGQNQAAMQVFSGGSVDVTSGIVRTTQNSDGISIASGTDIVVRSTTVTNEGANGGFGIVLGANRGGGGFNSDANGIQYTSATVTSGSVTTAGAGANAIYATPNGAGTTTITSGAITTTGANANGILVGAIGTGTIGGATTINSTGALTTSGATAAGIRYNGGTGTLAINNTGTITTNGANSVGVLAFNANGATVASNAIVTTGTGVASGIQVGARTGAANAVSITSGTIDIRNAAATGSGISVTTSGATPTTIASTTITNAGTGGGIFVSNAAGATGNVSVTSGDITLGGAATTGFRPAISTFQTGGTTTINSTGTIQSSGQGIVLQGRDNQPAGTVEVNSNVLTANAAGIDVNFGSAVTVRSTTLTTNAAGSTGIRVSRADGTELAGTTANVTSGRLTAAGTGISVQAGATTITSTDLTAGSAGISAFGAGAKTVTSGAVATTAAGATAISATSLDQSAVTVKSTGITGFGSGISASGGANMSIESGTIALQTTATSNPNSLGGLGISAIMTGAAGTLDIKSGSLIYTGTGNTVGISAQQVSAGGVLNITSGTVSVTGNGGYGILGVSGAAAITINSTGDVTTRGTTRAAGGSTAAANQRYADGILALSATGTISVTSGGTISTSGNTARGIVVEAGRGAQSFGPAGTEVSSANLTVNNTGTIRTGGQNAQGILVRGDQNAISVTSNAVVTTGATSDGIAISGTTGAVTVKATDTRVTSGTGISVLTGANSAAAVNVDGGLIRASGTGVTVSGPGLTGAVTVAVADAVTGAAVVDARSVGAVSVTSGTAQATGAGATGLVAISSGAAASVTSTNLTTVNRAIFASGLNDTTVTSGSVAVTNADSAIIATTAANTAAGAAAGTVRVTSGSVLANNVGINAFGPRAAIFVDSGTVSTTGSYGIQAYGVDATVRSTQVTTGGYGIDAGFANGAPTIGTSTINSGTITINGTTTGTTGGILATNRAVTIVSDTIAASGTGNRFGIFAQAIGGLELPGNVAITSKDITTVGNGAQGIFGIASGGTVDITSTGTITTVGDSRTVSPSAGVTQQRLSAGIIGASQNGAITIRSNNVTTSGTDADGIHVEQGSGLVNYNQTAVAPAAVSVTSEGTIRTGGTNAAGVRVLGGGGTVAVANTGSIQTTGNGATGIAVQAGAGATNVTSTLVSTQGTSATGIAVDSSTGAIGVTATTVSTAGLESAAVRAQSSGGTITLQTGTVTTASAPAIFASTTDGAVSITAATTTAGTAGTGAGGVALVGADAILGRSTNGAVTISGGTVTANNATAINAQAGTIATVSATSANATGEGSAGIRAVGGTGVSLNVAAASSTGATGGTRADAVFAEALTGAITASVGSASAQGAGADGIHLVANGTGGAVTLNVSGTVSSAAGNGIFIDPPGASRFTIAAGASVTGALAGIDTDSATGNTIVNAGTVRSTGGAAIVATGATTLDNAGTIAGTGATAVQFGASNDSVVLRAGSTVTGAIQGGGGTDAATLIGTGTAPVASQSVATLRDFATLTVQSGYWTVPTTAANPSTVAATAIATGAALEVASGTAGIAGLQTGTIAANGTLVVRSTGTAADTFGATTVTGTGGVRFTGTGTATLAGTNTIGTTGTNTVDAGARVVVTGTQGGNFANNGTFQIGTGGTTGTFTGNIAMGDAATLIIDRSNAYSYNGALTGNGTFIKNGAGQVTFGTGYAFTGVTQLNGGSIRLSTPVAANTELDVRGSGTVDLSGQSNTVAELQGNSSAASVNIAGGALTVNQSTSTSFAGNLTGNGALTKTGTGTLNLTGTNTYTGPTTVAGGTLAVNGSIASAVTVTSGGALGGAGTINAPVTIGAGGSFAPGNSPGTTTVNGPLTFAAGSTYAAEVTAAGAADRIIVNGTATINGGTVAVNASGNFLQGQLYNYNLITASGGVTGRFANVTSNLAFLSPLLGYTSNAVNLTLVRNDVSFRSLASGANATAVAVAIGGRTFGDTVFNSILFQPTTTAATAFDQLSGELYATVPAVLVDGGRRVRELVLNRAGVAEDGIGLWADGLQSFSRSRQQGGFAQARTNRSGVYGGVDFGNGDLRFGVNGGYIDQDIRVAGRASTANVDTKLVGASVAYRPVAGRISAMGGLTYAWHDIDAARSVAVTGLAGSFATSSDASSTEAFAEVAYAMPGGPITVSPFLRYAHDWTRADAVAETGGAAALSFGRDRRDVGFATVGARFGGAAPLKPGLSLQPKGTLSYERAFGDLRDGRSAAFAGTGPAFTTSGVRIGRDTFTADLGGDLVFDSGLRVGLGGFVSESKQWREYGAKATVGFRF